MDSNGSLFCPCCGQASVLVYVHGHGQCSRCGTNIEPCCQGAPLGSCAGMAELVDARDLKSLVRMGVFYYIKIYFSS